MSGLDRSQLTNLQLILKKREAELSSLLTFNDEPALATSRMQNIQISASDNAVERTLYDLATETAEHDAAELTTVRQALTKFSAGTYGVCELCGEGIGFSRLNALPEARLCIACQTRIEKVK